MFTRIVSIALRRKVFLSAPRVIGASLAFAGVGMSAFAAHSTVFSAAPPKDPKANGAYYQRVYDTIAKKLDALEYDDGSFAPVLVRLAWHAAGTYDKKTNTGGSNGASMRFKPESGHGANAGLSIARDLLESVKNEYPTISYADLWSLAGVVAIQEMGGPKIAWRAGRSDAKTDAACTPDGRLPDATQGGSHLRAIFGRMGFTDQEIVALSGAHALGRCHKDRSGFVGPWTRSPTTFSNSYFSLLLSEKWVETVSAGGKTQYKDAATGDLMMLPTDMTLLGDAAFRPWVEAYAADRERFNADFAAVYRKLLELGVPFAEDAPTIALRTTA